MSDLKIWFFENARWFLSGTFLLLLVYPLAFVNTLALFVALAIVSVVLLLVGVANFGVLQSSEDKPLTAFTLGLVASSVLWTIILIALENELYFAPGAMLFVGLLSVFLAGNSAR